MRAADLSHRPPPTAKSTSDVDTVIGSVDTDGDGYINYNEFTQVIMEKLSAR